MLDKVFAKWWLARVGPFKDVPPEKLEADREAMRRQQDYNRNYGTFLNEAVLPAVDALTQFLRKSNRLRHQAHRRQLLHSFHPLMVRAGSRLRRHCLGTRLRTRRRIDCKCQQIFPSIV